MSATKVIRSALIIDDNDADIYLSTHFLKRSGRFENVWGVTAAEDALQLFRDYDTTKNRDARFPPDLILLDINMPRMNGFEFLEALRQVAAPTPNIVMLTSSDHERDRATADKDPNVVGYLLKPLSAATAAKLADQFGLVDSSD